MSDTAKLESTVCYSGASASAAWMGHHVIDDAAFKRYVREVVRARVADEEASFDAELRALATTGMATEFVEQLLRAVPAIDGWEVGEALAECALKEDSSRQVFWPWNTARDRRTPRASLPGSDLVGFLIEDGSASLLIGEVKTSSDAGTPPNVMYGGSGMVWQLEQNATRLEIQHALLKWLHSRCRLSPHRELYEQAAGRYLSSLGRDFALIGVLLRDTPPSELDLQSRALALSTSVQPPTRVELLAWYLPVPIAEWPALVKAAA